MTTEEMSLEFDIAYNNITSNQAPGLNEYEKSVFLTKAQNELIVMYYSGRNNAGVLFDSTEEGRSYLSSLLSKYHVDISPAVSEYSVPVPSDVLFTVQESCMLTDSRIPTSPKKAMVLPVSYDTLYNASENPFTGQSDNIVLKVIGKNTIELSSKYKISSYDSVFLTYPTPIVLVDFSAEDGVSVDGLTVKTECALPEILHRTIVTSAVLLAKQA